MTTRSRDRTLRLAAAALLLTALVGCSDDEPQAEPTPSTSGETEPSPTDEPTEPEVDPASGPVIREQVATLRAPAKWVTEGDQLFTDAEREPRNDAGLRNVYGFIELDVDDTGKSLSLDEAAREAATSPTTEGKRVDDGELGGEPAFVFTTSLNAFGSTDYTIGLAHDQSLVVLTFSLIGAGQRDRTDLIESVLATWEWQQ